MLRIPLDFSPDASYKRGGFSETLLEEGLKFVPSRGNGIVAFNLSFVLLSVEVNLVSKEQGYKRDAFVACSSSRIKIIARHMQAPIVKIGISGFKKIIVGYGTYLKLAMFLAFNEQF